MTAVKRSECCVCTVTEGESVVAVQSAKGRENLSSTFGAVSDHMFSQMTFRSTISKVTASTTTAADTHLLVELLSCATWLEGILLDATGVCLIA
jgi:hypothetical protein